MKIPEDFIQIIKTLLIESVCPKTNEVESDVLSEKLKVEESKNGKRPRDESTCETSNSPAPMFYLNLHKLNLKDMNLPR